MAVPSLAGNSHDTQNFLRIDLSYVIDYSQLVSVTYRGPA